MRKWKLYWVTTPCPIENSFVVAATARQAASYEENGSGFDIRDCEAEYVASVPERIEQIAKRQRIKSEELSKDPWPGYARPWLLRRMSASKKMRSGRTGWYLNGRFFARGSFEESYLDPPENKVFVIRTVNNLLNKVRSLHGDRWTFRGQADALWKLQASIHRTRQVPGRSSLESVDSEKRLLKDFKNRSVPFLSQIPRDDLEWLFVAQHHAWVTYATP